MSESSLVLAGGSDRSLSSAHAFEIEEALADAREEVDAVREINRVLLADRNRPAR